jgi:hypothetical protein
VRYNPGTYLPGYHYYQADGDRRTVGRPTDQVDATLVRDPAQRYAARDGCVAALEGIKILAGLPAPSRNYRAGG